MCLFQTDHTPNEEVRTPLGVCEHSNDTVLVVVTPTVTTLLIVLPSTSVRALRIYSVNWFALCRNGAPHLV